jgi:hypothetical protein
MDPQPTQKISETVCIPVIISRSSFTPDVTLTLPEQTKLMTNLQEYNSLEDRPTKNTRRLVKQIKWTKRQNYATGLTNAKFSSMDGNKIHITPNC